MNYTQRLVDEELAIKGGIGDVKMSAIRVHTWDKNTFVARTKSEFANRPVLHKSPNTIWSTGQLTNSEFVLVANVLLSHVSF